MRRVGLGCALLILSVLSACGSEAPSADPAPPTETSESSASPTPGLSGLGARSPWIAALGATAPPPTDPPPTSSRLYDGANGAPNPQQVPSPGPTAPPVTGGGPTDQAASSQLPVTLPGDGVESGDADAALTVVRRLAAMAPGGYADAINQGLKLVNCGLKSGKVAFRAYGRTDANSPIEYSEIGLIAILTRNSATDWQFLLCSITGGVIGGGGAEVAPCAAVYDYPRDQPAESRFYVLLAATNPHMCRYMFNAHYNNHWGSYYSTGWDMSEPWTG